MPSLTPHGQLADASVCVILRPRLDEWGSHVDGVWGGKHRFNGGG